MSKHNAISVSVDKISSMTPDEINDIIAHNPYMTGSKILASIKSGISIELRKQIDSFTELEDASLSDILHILSGYIPLGKISTDGSRYYIAGSNALIPSISVNSDSEISNSSGTEEELNRFSVNKIISFDSYFTKGSKDRSRLVSTFNTYAFAEILSIISAHKMFSSDSKEKVSGYHYSIDNSGQVSKFVPGSGCYFSELMDGLSIETENGEISGGLNDVLRALEDVESKGQADNNSLYPTEPLRSNYKNDQDGELRFNSAMNAYNQFVREIDEAISSGYINSNGAFSRLMLKKLIMFNNVSTKGLKSLILNDANKLISNTDIENRLHGLGMLATSSVVDVVASAYLRKRISEIEVSKVIFGNPQEYGSIKKSEKRTQSFNTTFSIPVKYSELNTRPNGDDVPIDFAKNTFRCKFGKDLEKTDKSDHYDSVLDTPGTVMISPYLYREMLIRSRGWTDDAEAEFNKIMKNGKNGGNFDSISNTIKFNPLKLIYVGSHTDQNGEKRQCMIKAQFVPLFSDSENRFGTLYEEFTDPDVDKRIHMFAMEDSVKTGFIDGGIKNLDITDLGMISIPRDSKPKYMSLLRKLLLFNNANFNASIESMASEKLYNFVKETINENGVVDLESFRSISSEDDGVDLDAAIDYLSDLQKKNPDMNPLDYVGMFDVISNKINGRIADAFDFDMKGTQCSAITERIFTKKKLEFSNSEGSMDIMVPMEYFGDVVKGLSYNDSVAKLEKLGYIGGKASKAIIARNPIQGHSSISPAKIVGVFPRNYGYCISTASEFLNANGGDYDGDKYFLFPVNQENAPEANKLVYDMLLEERMTMASNVDEEVNRFEAINKRVKSEIDAIRGESSGVKQTKTRYTDTYVSEVSGLGLVGICVNMISGLLSYIKNDVSFENSKGKLVRSKDEIDESLATVSGLFSLAVDIATNPMLQDLGITSKKFKLAFGIAALTDMETAVKFMNSRLIHINPSLKSGNYNFKLFTDKNRLKEMIDYSMTKEGFNTETTEEEQMMMNTVNRFAGIFSTLKHADDFYDFIRSNGYFDAVIQSKKVSNSIDKLTKSNSSFTSFSVAAQSAAGLSNANLKLKTLSDILSTTSDFLTIDFIRSVFESSVLDSYYDSQGSIDEDGFESEYSINQSKKDPYDSFVPKVILDKIITYVSYKIGSGFFNENFSKKQISNIRNYMREEFGISFSVDRGYIHSVTASQESLYRLAESNGDNPMVYDFFRMYYASAGQRNYLSDKNQDIRKAIESNSQDEYGDVLDINDYYKLPGAIISMKHAVKFGVKLNGSQVLSKEDIKIFGKQKSAPIGASRTNAIVDMINPVKSDLNGNNTIDIVINSQKSMSNGDIIDSFEKKSFNIKGQYSKNTLLLMKDLLFSLENKIPIINTNLSDSEISAVLSSMKDDGSLGSVHIVSNDSKFISGIQSGVVTTSSNNISDAIPGSVVLTKNFNNFIGYNESDLDVFELAELFNVTILNVNRNVQPALAYSNVSASTRDADIKISKSDYEAVILDHPGYTIVNADEKNLDKSDIYPVIGSSVKLVDKSKKIVTIGNIYDIVDIDVDGDMHKIIKLTTKFGDYSVHQVSSPLYNESVFIEPYINVATANKNSVKNAIIFTSNANSLNLKRLNNIGMYYIVEMNDSNTDKYKTKSEYDNDDINEMCTI